jgi:hypothetical protein
MAFKWITDSRSAYYQRYILIYDVSVLESDPFFRRLFIPTDDIRTTKHMLPQLQPIAQGQKMPYSQPPEAMCQSLILFNCDVERHGILTQFSVTDTVNANVGNEFEYLRWLQASQRLVRNVGS